MSAPAAETRDDVRTLRLTPASEITPKPVRWAWRDRLPLGEVSLTAGRAGVGKSTFLCWVAARITRGDLEGDLTGPHGVAIVAGEDSWERTIVPRLIATGADLERVYRVDVTQADVAGYSLSLPADTDRLAVAIGDHDLAAVVLDPLLTALHSGLDAHRDQDVRQALTPLSQVAASTGAAILGNAHLRKASASDVLSMVSGSLAFGAVARAVLGFAADADSGEHVLSLVKSNLGRGDVPDLAYRLISATVDTDDGPSEVARFTLDGTATRQLRDLLTGDDDGRTERDEAAQWLTEYLEESGGLAPAADVKRAASRTGIAPRTLDRARGRAGVTTARQGFGKGASYTWALPSCTPHVRHGRQDTDAGEHGEHVASMGRSAADAATSPLRLVPPEEPPADLWADDEPPPDEWADS